MVRMLVTELGCNPEVLTKNGDTAVLIAARECHSNVVRALVGELGACPDVKNKAGISPFVAAAYAGDKETCRILLEHGAQSSSQHLPCISSLRHLGHHGIVQLIESLQRIQRMARAGCVHHLQDLVKSAEDSLAIQWVGMLPGPAAKELDQWAQSALHDSARCFMALFGPVGKHNELSYRFVVGHDGLPHVSKAIVSYLVYKDRGVRKKIRDLAKELQNKLRGGKKNL